MCALPQRQLREKYDLLKQLGSQHINTYNQGWMKGKFKGIHLNDAIKIVQEELKNFKGSEAEEIEHKELLERAGLGHPASRDKVVAMIKKIMVDKRLNVVDGLQDNEMTVPEAIYALTRGGGWIDDLWKQKDVEEVQVNDTDIFVMKHGVSTKHHRKFDSRESVYNLQERLALYGRKTISEQHPYCYSYMYNRSRLTMARPPFSSFPMIAIRNFILKDPSLEMLIEKKTINRPMAKLLRLLVKHHASIFIGGSTKTGKTTTLFALCREFSKNERILTLESEFEVMLDERLPGRNIIPFQSVPELEISMSEAFQFLLRSSPDRIVVGEIRGPEAAQAIQAALRGHDTLVTGHSKYRGQVVNDIVDMVKQSGVETDDLTLRNRIARAFDIVVFQKLIPINDKRSIRVMTEITEVCFNEENGDIQMNPLIVWDTNKNNWVRTENRLSDDLKDHLILNGARKEDFQELGVW